MSEQTDAFFAKLAALDADERTHLDYRTEPVENITYGPAQVRKVTQADIDGGHTEDGIKPVTVLYVNGASRAAAAGAQITSMGTLIGAAKAAKAAKDATQTAKTLRKAKAQLDALIDKGAGPPSQDVEDLLRTSDVANSTYDHVDTVQVGPVRVVLVEAGDGAERRYGGPGFHLFLQNGKEPFASVKATANSYDQMVVWFDLRAVAQVERDAVRRERETDQAVVELVDMPGVDVEHVIERPSRTAFLVRPHVLPAPVVEALDTADELAAKNAPIADEAATSEPVKRSRYLHLLVAGVLLAAAVAAGITSWVML